MMLPKLLLMWLLSGYAAAVRIGVAKEDSSTTIATSNATTEPITTTTAITPSDSTTTTNTITTKGDAENDDLSTLSSTEQLLNVSSAPPTNVRESVVPTLPTTTAPTTTAGTKKKTKTYIRTSTTTPSTTTAAIATTTAAGSINASTGNETAATAIESVYCACDLTRHACDLNCCCDDDCHEGRNTALRVFDCHAPTAHPELRHRLEDFQYQHGLPSCRINDGWLCVFRTNTASVAQQRREQQRQLAAMHANHDTTRFYKWPDSQLELSTLATERGPAEVDFYKYGAALQVWHKQARQQKPFVLPAAFGNSPLCHIRTAVRHLRAERRLCKSATLALRQQQQRSLLSYIEDTVLLPPPEPWRVRIGYDAAPAAAIKWQLQRCQRAECEPATQFVAANVSVLDAARIVLQLQHNYTHITGALVQLHGAAVDSGAELRPPLHAFWQVFDVQFVRNGSGEGAATRAVSYSGPLGYLQGEPIIVARALPPHSNDSAALPPPWRLDYFENAAAAATPTSPLSTLHLFSQHGGGLCRKDATHAIAYGVNALKSCRMHLGSERTANLSDSSNSNNYTQICAQLQARAWSLLFDERITLAQLIAQPPLVSQYGRPQNRSDAWLPLHVLPADELHGGLQALPPITGIYSAHTRTFVCHNVLLSLTYEFQVGAFTVNDQRQQQLITHAALRLGTRLDLEFELDESLAVPLGVSVMFYDRVVSEEMDAAGAARSDLSHLGGVFNIIMMFTAVLLT